MHIFWPNLLIEFVELSQWKASLDAFTYNSILLSYIVSDNCLRTGRITEETFRGIYLFMIIFLCG